MAIRQRKGRKKPWEVYWNNPFTLKRESLYVETEEEAKKQDALKKFQLKYERDFFRREEAEAPQVEHTFESAYYLFLKDKRFSERSLERHLKNMKRSLAFLKDTPLSDIDNTKLKQLMSHFLSFGIRASTLKRCIGQVFSVIRWAYQNELLRELPRIPKLPHIEYEHFIPPTQQELALVFVHAPEHVRRVVILGSQMGMRVGPSELFGLMWSDVDLENKVIHLRAAQKNKAEPVRDIPIRQSLVEELKAWQEVDRAKRVASIIHYGGKPVKCIHGAWHRTLLRAGIQRRIRPYDLRHAFVTEAIAAGVDIGTVGKLVGHANLTMILKHYQHVLSSQKRAAVEAIPEPQYVAKNMWQSESTPENIKQEPEIIGLCFYLWGKKRPPFGGLVLRLAAVGCFVLVLSNRLCRRLPHLRFRDNQNHHCFAHRNRLLFIVAHVLGASAAASSFRNFVHLSRPPFVEYRFKACAQPFHPIPLLLLL